MDSAFGILLSRLEDNEIQQYFTDTAFPPLEVINRVLESLRKRSSMTVEDLGAELNYTRSAIDKALRLLEVEGAVEHGWSGYSRTAKRWPPDFARLEQVTRHRHAELEETALAKAALHRSTAWYLPNTDVA